MWRKFIIKIIVSIGFAGFSFASLSAEQTTDFDWSIWDGLLRQHVISDTREGIGLNVLDYPSIKQSTEFKRLLDGLAGFDPGLLSSRESRLAFYINAYNILAVKMIIDHWKPQSIRDIGHFLNPVWKHDAGEINHQKVTLHQIEHEILRPMGEPRIHFSIVCASISCPDLRPEAFTANRLNDQLNDQVSQFLKNAGKGLRITNKVIRVSSIFDWFEDDFKSVGGVDSFIRQYTSGLPSGEIEADLDYNWHLNY